MIAFEIPSFRPHPLVRGGHAQTIVGNYLTGPLAPHRAVARLVDLPAGDSIVLHDDRPDGWRTGDRTALLIHGLAGCHQSPYMVRIAARLAERGVRTFRMDLRNCGAGRGLSRLPYHAGRSEDALAALLRIAEWCPDSPIGVAGFSLGGNIALKLLGEFAGDLPAGLDRAVAVNPPLELARCVDGLRRPGFGIYDRHFVQLLTRQLADSRKLLPEIPATNFARLPRRIEDFDAAYTAPVCGFGTADNYYALSSAAQFVPHIRVQTLILAAEDDPLIPVEIFRRLTPSKSTIVHIASSGGHLGYIGRRGIDPDRRWMDWRVVDSIAGKGETCKSQRLENP